MNQQVEKESQLEPKVPEAVLEQQRKGLEAWKSVYEPDKKTESEPAPEGKETAQDGEEHNLQTPEPEQEPVKQEPKSDGWEQKYKVLKGKYDKEIPRLNQQVREMTAQITTLQNQLQHTQQQVSEASTQASSETPKTVDPSAYEDYGDEIKMLAEKLNTALDDNERLKSELGSIKEYQQSDRQERQATAQERFFTTLDDRLPNWREVNEDSDFHSWLAEVHPYTGQARQAHLTDAEKNLDVGRVVSIFQDFLDQSGRTAPQGKGDNVPAPEPEPQEKPKPKNVQPSKRKADAPPQDNKKTYTRAEIEKHYAERTQGKWGSRLDEWERIAKDMKRAVANGEVE